MSASGHGCVRTLWRVLCRLATKLMRGDVFVMGDGADFQSNAILANGMGRLAMAGGNGA